tara:strand:- start:726 stop:1319 length:594 start_codon:yes stop_codon:yes gene_type:complete
MKIQLKRSNVLQSGSAKEPLASQLEYGELAVNYNNTDPAIFIKDSSNNIIRISGVGNISDDGLTNVPSGTTPPTNPTPESGNLWYNSDEGRLYIYYVDANTSQWVDASPDSWDPSSYPDVSNPSSQPNTLDDRYVLASESSSGLSGGGTDEIVMEFDKTVTSSYTITNGKNALAVGPITINNGVTLTVPNNSTLVVV